MTFNQREKILIGAALAVLGLLVADRYALSPLLEQRDNAHARRDLRQRETAGSRRAGPRPKARSSAASATGRRRPACGCRR